MKIQILLVLVGAACVAGKFNFPCRYDKQDLAPCVAVHIDLNGNGIIDTHEIDMALIAYKDQLPKKFDKHYILDLCDSNKDGKLTMPEIMGNSRCDGWCIAKMMVGKIFKCKERRVI